MEHNILEKILDGSMKPTNLPLETLRKITDGFSADRIIGEGGFGTVYKGVVRNGNVAVKRIRSSMTIDQKLFRREADSLMEINHKNIVRFLGLCSHTVETPMKNPDTRRYIFVEIRERLLCFEYITNGSLDTKITDELRGLEWDKRYEIIKGICAGLHYLHMEKHILHMDLKPANILLDNEMVPKITDFGLSRPTAKSYTMTTHHYSSLGYTAPENRFCHGRMSVKSDMYSLGVIIIEVVTGHKVIPDDSNNILRRWRHRWNKSGKETPLMYHQQVSKCIEIGSLCQKIDPYARPSISEVMSQFVEMEKTNNHASIAAESTVGQINPLHWEDDMLGVEPLELKFRYNYKNKKILSCSVELSNDTDSFIAFNILSMNPLSYSIEPNKDIVKPRSKCCVDIKVNEGLTLKSQKYKEDFTVRSIKVHEGFTTKDISQSMFDKHKSAHQVDEIHLGFDSEEPCCKEVIDFPSNHAKKQFASSGATRPTLTPVAPGSVQLVTRNNKRAPLLECNEKVLLELTGGDYTSARPGLDLVVVVDVSHGMRGEKMEQLKTALRFVVGKLSPIDRLCIVRFDNHGSKKLICRLKQTTDASRRELLELIDNLSYNGADTKIVRGLLAGLKVLANRKVSAGRVAAVMLISAGIQSPDDGKAADANLWDVPVYTFGLGEDIDPMLLSTVAANSMGGTFSHIREQDIGGGRLTMALSQCLAGLFTVSVEDLNLRVSCVGHESKILKVAAGSYPQTHDTGSVTVSFGNLYSREVRNVMVDLLLPAIDGERSEKILKVTYSYRSRYKPILSRSSGKLKVVSPSETITVWRTGGVEEEEKPAELQAEEDRLQTVKMIQEARAMAEGNRLRDAQQKLVEAHNMLEEGSNPLLTIELQGLFELLKSQETYQKHGRAFALSSESSHGRQRPAARGGDLNIMRHFATPCMDKYIEQVYKFPQAPEMMPLPSVDEHDSVDVASRKEEIRILSWDPGYTRR